jgi:hypothetical protein
MNSLSVLKQNNTQIENNCFLDSSQLFVYGLQFLCCGTLSKKLIYGKTVANADGEPACIIRQRFVKEILCWLHSSDFNL